MLRFSAALLIFSLFLSGCSLLPPVLSPETTSENTDPVAIEPGEAEDIEKLADNLWKYTFPSVPETARCDENGRILSIESVGYDFRLTLTDVFTGKSTTGTYSPSVGDEYLFLQAELISGVPVVFEIGSGVLAVLDSDFGVTDSIRFDDAYAGLYRTGTDRAAVVATDPPSYVPITVKDGKIISDKTDIDLSDNEMLNYAVCFPTDTQAILSVFDQETDRAGYVLYDLSDGSEETLGGIPEKTMIHGMCGDILVMGNYDDSEVRLYDTRKPGLISTAALPESDSGVNISVCGSHVYYSYLAEDGRHIGQIAPGTGETAEEIIFPESESSFFVSAAECRGYTVVLLSGEENYTALIWKPEKSKAPQSGFSGLTGDAGSSADYAACLTLAENLAMQNGVDILLGENAVCYFDGYAVLPTDDWERTYEVLGLLSDFFSKLPDGMMNEVSRRFDEIEIRIVGNILPDTTNRDSISDAVGFTVCRNSIEYCVLNTSMSTEDLTTTIPHEFFHIFEQAMVRMGQETDNFDSWNDHNPRTFIYSYVYTDENGSTIKTADPELLGTSYEDGVSDPDRVYFVDGYSTTYPKEDRARIFEVLFTRADDLPDYFKGEHIRAKAEYLSECLRKAFYSVSVCDDVIWEEGLKKYAE